MGLLFAMIIGLLAGAVAGALLQENYDLLFMNAAIGIAGGLVGLGLYALLGSGDGALLLSWAAILFEIISAAAAVIVFSLLHKAAPETGSATPED